MPYRFVLIALLLGAGSLTVNGQPTPATAQVTADQAIRATIDSLFDGMRAGDSAAVRAVFHEDARLHTALGPTDTATVRGTSVDAFVDAVGRPHENVWDERIWDVQIRVDGPLATAWVPYAFYLGDELSHCGVNAIQFIRQHDGWRILQVTDTRRQECAIPDRVAKPADGAGN